MPRNKFCRSRSRRGAVLVLVAICLVALLGVGALSLDAGRMYNERARAQAAADAAADAAGYDLYENYRKHHGVDVARTARASALEIAKLNGYEASKVTVNIPPASGPNKNKPGYAEVIIGNSLSRTFSAIFGSSALDVKARAVGAGTETATVASILLLENGKKKGALRLKGKQSYLEVAGNIFINSPSSKSVRVSKKNEIKADELVLAGGIDSKSKGMIDAQITTGASPTADPLAGVIAPPPPGTKRKASDYREPSEGHDRYNLQPGSYSELKFDHEDEVVMAPGVYYVDGGAIEFKDRASLQAQGVMIYSGSKKTIKFKTSGNIKLSPPTSGTYKGVSLFQNAPKKGKIQFNKSGNIDLSGIVYAPRSEVKFSKSDVEIKDPSDDEDWSDEYEPIDDEDVVDGDPDGSDDEIVGSANQEIGASIIARRLTISKKTTVVLKGSSIPVKLPIRGLVE